MKDLKAYNIPFVGLSLGKHHFKYEIDNTFLDFFDFNELIKTSVEVTILLEKKETLLNLEFLADGFVKVNCDISNEPFDQPIKDILNLVVKFGAEFNNDNDDILILPHEEYQVNVAQYIYELIVLAVPSKRIHPKVKDGTMQSETLRRLEELNNIENPVEKTAYTDPRWDKLKDLLT